MAIDIDKPLYNQAAERYATLTVPEQLNLQKIPSHKDAEALRDLHKILPICSMNSQKIPLAVKEKQCRQHKQRAV